MAQATLLQLLDLPDDDTDDIIQELDLQFPIHRRRRPLHLDPCWSSEFDIFASDLSSVNQNPSGGQQSSIDSINDVVSEPESVLTSADVFDVDNQVDFVMDLFHQRVQQSRPPRTHFSIDADLGFDATFGSDEFDLTHLELDLGLAFPDESSSADVAYSGFLPEDFDTEEHPLVSGLRDIDMDSDSGSELSRNAAFHCNGDDIDGEHVCGDLDDDDADDDDDVNFGLCWDSFQIEDPNEDMEWEEVNEGIDEREVLNMFFDDGGDDDASVMAREDREALNMFFDDGGDDDASLMAREDGDSIGVMRSSDWEVLFNVTDVEIGIEGFSEVDFGDHEYNYATLLERLHGSEVAILGKPPAAKGVVENLPLVVFTDEDLKKDDMTCAVCKDEMGVGQDSRELPCNHRYHGDCIIPWLGIRNTCPVCRFELPTDNEEYEKRKRHLSDSLFQ